MNSRCGVVSVLVAVVLQVTASPLQAQTAQPAPAPTPSDAVTVYIDCVSVICDYDFLRTEITFIQHVRDRHDAQVHVIVTGEQTAEGGTEFTLRFIGQQEFRGVEDTLQFTSRPPATADQIRGSLAQVIKRGLVRYANHTPLADALEISYQAPIGQPAAAEAPDPWNYWTFSSTLNTFLDGEEAISSMSVGLGLTASRTTREWKLDTSVQGRYSRSTFELGEQRSIASIQRNFAFNALVVNSVTDRWSAGARVTALTSTFLNQKSTLRLAPAVEYNVFPYDEWTRRSFTIQYSLGANAFDYDEVTLFGKTAEKRLDQRILATFRTTQPWGSITSAIEGSNYLHDFAKHRAIVFSSVDVNFAKGMSLVTFANVQLIRDQIFLPARGIGEDEILLRQRQLATSFSYSFSVGLSYTFGSARATIVNPRFQGSVGGTSLGQ